MNIIIVVIIIIIMLDINIIINICNITNHGKNIITIIIIIASSILPPQSSMGARPANWLLWIDTGDIVPALQWRHTGGDGISNYKPHQCLLNRLFRRWSKKTSKLRVTGFLWGEFTGHRWIPRTNGQ